MGESSSKGIPNSPLRALKGNVGKGARKKFLSNGGEPTSRPLASKARAPESPANKQKEGYWLSVEVVERVRNAVDAPVAGLSGGA
jgi:hypothetical protein